MCCSEKPKPFGVGSKAGLEKARSGLSALPSQASMAEQLGQVMWEEGATLLEGHYLLLNRNVVESSYFSGLPSWLSW